MTARLVDATTMRLLAIDTAANLCAACVFDTQAGEEGRAVLDLGKGHAEHLMGVIADALKAANMAYQDLDGIVVCVGPGSFTGVRVGVSAARGLALALDVPAIGVSTLEGLAREAMDNTPGQPVIARIEAGRGQAYLAAFTQGGAEEKAPAVWSLADADELIGKLDPHTLIATGTTADIAVYARLGGEKLAATPAPEKPRPLYLRDADARPQGSFALPRKTAS